MIRSPTLLFLSLSRLVVAVHLQDNTWSLVLVYPTITIPVSVWLLVGFLKSIPKDIEEQAMVDGYSRLGAFVRAVVPLVFPGIVAVIVFTFTLAASEFIYALAFVSPTAEKVISTGVPTELVRGDVFFWQSLQAATVLVALPIAFVFNLFLDRFISGSPWAPSKVDHYSHDPWGVVSAIASRGRVDPVVTQQPAPNSAEVAHDALTDSTDHGNSGKVCGSDTSSLSASAGSSIRGVLQGRLLSSRGDIVEVASSPSGKGRCLCVCPATGCAVVESWLASPGSDLSEELVVGVEPAALDVRVAPRCPPGLAACRCSSVIMVRQIWLARRRFRHRRASRGVCPRRVWRCGSCGRGCRVFGSG
jgi:hypothetical protein